MCRSSGGKNHTEESREKSSRRDSTHEVMWHASRIAGKKSRRNQNCLRRVRHVRQGHHDESSESIYSDSDNESIDEDIARIIQHIDVHRTAQPNAENNSCKIWRDGAKVKVEPDMDADANVMNEYHFNELVRTAPKLKSHDTQIKLKTLTENLPKSTNPRGMHRHSGKWNKESTSYNCSNSREKWLSSTIW